MFNATRLDDLLRSFRDLRIALVGDLFLDRYLYIEPEASELSIETGLEAYQVTKIRNSPGALGTVVNNLAALGVERITPFSVIGQDGQAADLLAELNAAGVDATGILQSADRLTPTYTKPLQFRGDEGWCELNRFDIRDRKPINKESSQRLASMLLERLPEFDGLIVLDQIVEADWGVVNDGLRSCLRQAQKNQPSMLFFSDSRQHLKHFDFGVVKCNQAELLRAMGREANATNASDVKSAALALSQRNGCAAFCTLGEKGVLAALPDGRSFHAPAYPLEGPTDIVGAGDAASSAIVCGLLSGANAFEAAVLANLAASITVEKIGETGVATADEIRARFARFHDE